MNNLEKCCLITRARTHHPSHHGRAHMYVPTMTRARAPNYPGG